MSIPFVREVEDGGISALSCSIVSHCAGGLLYPRLKRFISKIRQDTSSMGFYQIIMIICSRPGTYHARALSCQGDQF